jgi:tetratricopeptide (TPR) repeat protein
MTTVQSPGSRNAPCPCGSGRRYKDCHGALGQASVAPVGAGAAVQARRAALLNDALARQHAGDLAGATAAYEAALAEFPDDFDALHMLGVVHYQRHAFDRAEALLRAAIARNPLIASAQQNLSVLLEARRLEAAQDALCREILPRLAHLCAPVSAFDSIARERRGIDLLAGAAIDASHDATFGRLAAGAIGPAHVHRAVPERTTDAPAHAPTGSLVAPVTVLYGVATPLAAFAAAPDGAARVLLVDADAPSSLHDRLRELSDEARHPVHVRYATAALAATLGLPGGVLFGDDDSRYAS